MAASWNRFTTTPLGYLVLRVQKGSRTNAVREPQVDPTESWIDATMRLLEVRLN